MNLLFTYTCSCTALTDTIWNTTSGSCFAMPTRIVAVNQILSMSTSCFWLVFVSGRLRGKKKQYPKLPGLLLDCLFWNQTVIFIVYTKRRHCYINPLVLEHSGWPLLTVNSQAVVMFSVVQEQSNSHMLVKSQTWFKRWIQCALSSGRCLWNACTVSMLGLLVYFGVGFQPSLCSHFLFELIAGR